MNLRPLGQSAGSSTRICVHLPKTQQLGPECWVIHRNMCLAVIVIVIVINFNNQSGRRRVRNIHYQLCIISVSLLTHVISIAAGWARATWNEMSSNVTANDVDGCSWSADGPAATAVAVKKLDSFGSFERKSCLWSFFFFLCDPLSYDRFMFHSIYVSLDFSLSLLPLTVLNWTSLCALHGIVHVVQTEGGCTRKDRQNMSN